MGIAGYRSLLNALDPFSLSSKPNIQISDNLKFMFGLGYTMCPFGDFIDENLWFRYRDKLNMFVYFRQYQNKTKEKNPRERISNFPGKRVSVRTTGEDKITKKTLTNNLNDWKVSHLRN